MNRTKGKAASKKIPAKSSSAERKSVRSTKPVATTALGKDRLITKNETSAKSAGSKGTSMLSSIDRSKALRVAGWAVLFLLSLLLIDLAVQYLNNDLSAAVVNGSRVSQSKLDTRLRESYAAGTVQELITEELIFQQAREENIEVSKEDIDKRVDAVKEELGGDTQYEAALAANNLTDKTYRDRIRVELLATELIVDEPTDEELKTFFDSYKSVYYAEEDTFESVDKADLTMKYEETKMRELSGEYLQGLRDEAVIQNNVEEKPAYGVLQVTRNIINNIKDSIKNNKK